MPPNTVVVARPAKWGNPFRITYYRDAMGLDEADARKLAVKLFTECVQGRDEAVCPDKQDRIEVIRASIGELRGKNLACWCKICETDGRYVQCHADVLLSIANDISMEDVRRENLRRTKGEAGQ